MLETKEELRDLRSFFAGYSLADAVIAGCGYAVLLAHLIERERGAGLVLGPHKELISRILMLFMLLFLELIYSLHVALAYGVHKKRANIRRLKRHKWIVAAGTFSWLVVPRLPLDLAITTVVFLILNAVAALLASRSRTASLERGEQ